MVNLSTAPGGGVLANDVITYLPECSALRYEDVVRMGCVLLPGLRLPGSAALTPIQTPATQVFKNAESFDLTDSTYYVVSVWLVSTCVVAPVLLLSCPCRHLTCLPACRT